MDFVRLRGSRCPATRLTRSVPSAGLGREAERRHGECVSSEAGRVLLPDDRQTKDQLSEPLSG